MDLTKLSDEDLMALQSGDLTKVSDAGLAVLSGEQPSSATTEKKTRSWKDDVADFYKGQLGSAFNISQTLMTPVNRLIDMAQGNKGGTFAERNAATMDKEMNADKNSTAYKSGKLIGDIEATMPIGPVLGGGLKAIGLERLGNAVASGGFNLGGPSKNAFTDMATRVAGGAISGGASAGAVNPEDAGTGAAVGGALPLAVWTSGAVGRGVKNAFTPKDAELANKAINEYNIPLGPADITDNRTVKGVRSVLNDLPFIGRIGEKQKTGVQEGFNKAVGKTFGADASKLTPEVMTESRKRMGAEFDRIWNNNAINVDDQFVSKLSALKDEAAKLPKTDGDSLISVINDIESKIVDGKIPGDVANKYQQYLRRRVDGGAQGLKNELNDLRQTLISGFNRSVSPEDAAALTMNRSQYKAYKTVSNLLNKSEAGVAGRDIGDVPAALLPGQVASSYGDYISQSPFADLSQIGSKYVADRVPQTGGSPRALIQNSAIGTLLGLGGYSSPATAFLSAPTAALTNKALGSPALARRMLASNPNAFEMLMRSPTASIPLRALPVISAE